MVNGWLAVFWYFSPYLLLFCIAICISIVLARRIRWKKAIDNSLRENGVLFSGTVVTCIEKRWMADLKFTYEVQGNVYSWTQHVPRGTCNILHPGDTVAVVYDSQDPQKALLKDIVTEYVEVHPLTILYILELMFVLCVIGLLIVTLLTTLISRFFPPQ